MRELLAGCLLLLGVTAGAGTPPMLKGTVSEVAHADGCTYVRMDTGKEKVWVYGPQADVRLRDAVSVPGDQKKRKVTSKELDHTFRDIYYVADLAATIDLGARPAAGAAPDGAGGPGDAGEPPQPAGLPAGHPAVRPGAAAPGGAMGRMPGVMPAGHPPVQGMVDRPQGMPAGHPRVSGSSAEGGAESGIEFVAVARAEGGMTIAEILAGRDQLAGKEVLVRGQVTKANANIMNRHWIHLRDGSGEKERDDLAVTSTDDLPVVGSVVLCRGVLAVGKDFGLGYVYEVLLENASIVNE